MNWILLIVAGLLEVVWAIGLKYTEGFSRPVPTLITVAAIITSLLLLGMAMKSLPVGTAYAVWVGIGATGTAIVGILMFGESTHWTRLASLALIGLGVAGLKLGEGNA